MSTCPPLSCTFCGCSRPGLSAVAGALGYDSTMPAAFRSQLHVHYSLREVFGGYTNTQVVAVLSPGELFEDVTGVRVLFVSQNGEVRLNLSVRPFIRLLRRVFGWPKTHAFALSATMNSQHGTFSPPPATPARFTLDVHHSPPLYLPYLLSACTLRIRRQSNFHSALPAPRRLWGQPHWHRPPRQPPGPNATISKRASFVEVPCCDCECAA